MTVLPRFGKTWVLRCGVGLLGVLGWAASGMAQTNGECESAAVCPETDVNCDDVADGFDIAEIRSTANWLLATMDAANPRADVNGDGFVDGFDVAAVRNTACWLVPPVQSTVLSLVFDGLESLGEHFVYEGWLIADGQPVSTGRFSVDDEGEAHPSDFEVSAAAVEAATLFVLTIEPAEGDDPAPADTHILAGPFSAAMGADLTVGHPAALGDDFTAAAGGFILATPTTAGIAGDYDQGIWFVDPAGPAPSLDLPVLPAGWAYEGWVVGMDGPVSTGRFTDPAMADSDGPGPFAGPDGAPPFPGQDFIDPPTVLIGHAAVISIEPEPDNSPGPFTLKPLVDTDIEDVGEGVIQSLTNQAGMSPTGMVLVPSADTTVLSAEFDGLESLGGDFVYECWLIVGGMPVSTGRFNVDGVGQAYPSAFSVQVADVAAATVFVLTIEPAEGDDPTPADTHILAGAFDPEVGADVTIGHPAALGDDFTAASGGYILATPTTAAIDDDYDQGIWFLDPAGPAPSLDLPVLPAGWAYEGWVVGMDGPVTTGRFTDPAVADSDGPGPFAGPDGAPPFPGQDFIDPPTVLIGHAAVISIEPEPDNSPGPFTLKPLVDMEVEDVGAGVLQSLGNAAAAAPTGTIRLPSPTAEYELTFDAAWSAETHPQDFPPSPHFSGLVGGTHTATKVLWEEGGLATPGIESMAETGSKALLIGEVEDAIDAGDAESIISGGGIAVSPGSVSVTIPIVRDYPRATVVSMIAPSPDWFVGVSGLNLFAHNRWANKVTVVLHPYDAGTDSGVTYTSPNDDTVPREPISRITGFPLEDGGVVAPIGTFTFRRID